MSVINIVTAECSSDTSHCVDERSAHDLHDVLPAPPIDGDRLLERCLGNLNCTRTLLNEFVTTSRPCLDALDAGLTDGNYAAIAAKAHGLKGVAGILMASTLKELCFKLEAAAKDADEHRTRDLIQQLHHEIQRTLNFIPSLRAVA